MAAVDYYATLGLTRTATADQIKRTYRKLARKFHPDVSKEANAEARFKDIAAAYEVLGDIEKRAAYDQAALRADRRPANAPPPGSWDDGFEFSGRGFDPGDAAAQDSFFESLFRRQRGGSAGSYGTQDAAGEDHHARVQIDLLDAYRGAHRQIVLQVPQQNAAGQMSVVERTLEVNIPKGILAGQHLRLAGQGHVGAGGGSAGDLYLEVEFTAQSRFRIEGRDIYLELPVSPWEAALGAAVFVPLPDARIQMTIPSGSSNGRRLRLKGRGIPSVPPGDFYAVLAVVLPAADSLEAKAAYQTLADHFTHFEPRAALEH
jgi:curved DNA-binding protein